jgi:hypothetical protein
MSGEKMRNRSEEANRRLRDYHDHHETDFQSIMMTLLELITIFEKHDINYALFGGLAGLKLGRPRITHDIDILIHPFDADFVLSILEGLNFEVEKRYPSWLYKAWKNDVLVDLIFKSCGEIYLDDEVKSHRKKISFGGKWVQTISPEDYIMIKVAAQREDCPHHWYDALSVLKQGDIDWNYLLQRSRFAPRRLISLLTYAHSNDICVPSDIIIRLFSSIYTEQNQSAETLSNLVYYSE